MLNIRIFSILFFSGLSIFHFVFDSGMIVTKIHAKETLIQESFTGKAFNSEGKFVYQELHTIFKKDNNTLVYSKTRYLDNQGVEIANLVSDYSNNTHVPNYTFMDLRRNYQEGVKCSGSNCSMFRKESGANFESIEFTIRDHLFAGQGWHHYLSKNINRLKNQSTPLELVLPGRLDVFRLKLEQLSATDKEVIFKLQFENWLISLFTPVLFLNYDPKSLKILQYEGPSNIKNEKEESQQVNIIYLNVSVLNQS